MALTNDTLKRNVGSFAYVIGGARAVFHRGFRPLSPWTAPASRSVIPA